MSKLFLLWAILFSLPIFPGQILAADSWNVGAVIRDPRVLLIVQKDNPQCDDQLADLRQTGGTFEALVRRGWKIGTEPDCHIQIIDVTSLGDRALAWGLEQFPVVVCVEGQDIVRSFRDGCSTPLDVFTFRWLLNGYSERPAMDSATAVTVPTTNNYQLRGAHWNFEGSWSPGHAYMVAHLRGPNHVTLFPQSWPIETWADEELRSLHDDLHEMGRPRLPLNGSLEVGNSVRPGEVVPIYRPAVRSYSTGTYASQPSKSAASGPNAALKARSGR